VNRNGGDWLVDAASVTGSKHATEGVPNQDAFVVRRSADGRAVAVAVCDGAGSSAHGAEGAQFIAAAISEGLLALHESGKFRVDGWQGRVAVERLIETARDALVARVGSRLDDYNCTLTACLVSPNGALFAQIGDSVSVRGELQCRTQTEGPEPVSLIGTRLIPPHRGAYAGETRFVTEDTWRHHLVVEETSEEPQFVALMSDGAAELALQGDEPAPSFLSVLIKWIAESASERPNEIEQVLADERSARRVNDDRTLVILISRSAIGKVPSPTIATPVGLVIQADLSGESARPDLTPSSISQIRDADRDSDKLVTSVGTPLTRTIQAGASALHIPVHEDVVHSDRRAGGDGQPKVRKEERNSRTDEKADATPSHRGGTRGGAQALMIGVGCACLLLIGAALGWLLRPLPLRLTPAQVGPRSVPNKIALGPRNQEVGESSPGAATEDGSPPPVKGGPTPHEIPAQPEQSGEGQPRTAPRPTERFQTMIRFGVDPPMAEVFIDGTAIDPSRNIGVSVGEHSLRAVAIGYREFRHTFWVRQGASHYRLSLCRKDDSGPRADELLSSERTDVKATLRTLSLNGRRTPPYACQSDAQACMDSMDARTSKIVGELCTRWDPAARLQRALQAVVECDTRAESNPSCFIYVVTGKCVVDGRVSHNAPSNSCVDGTLESVQ
jgi:serine/threonine protein phosphatase PrpC